MIENIVKISDKDNKTTFTLSPGSITKFDVSELDKKIQSFDLIMDYDGSLDITIETKKEENEFLLAETLINRFTNYLKINSQSEDNGIGSPPSKGQLELASLVKDELRNLGCNIVNIDKNGYLYCTIEATEGLEDIKPIAFISHLDTSPKEKGGPVNWRIVSNYDGKDIVLNKKKNIILSPGMFRELKQYEHDDIIVTDGTTLLGADDKAGISSIITAIECILKNNIPHSKIKIILTPNEEIGIGVDNIDIDQIKDCEFGFTIDGGPLGEIGYETFYATNILITITGVACHTGEAKDKMINSVNIATDIANMLPSDKKPENTDGKEGFIHIANINGTCKSTSMKIMLRSHSLEEFTEFKQLIRDIIKNMNNKYSNCIDVDIKDLYSNMYEVIKNRMDIVELATTAMSNVGVTPNIIPIRGGTDGARLSFMGLPCPNLFTGGMNFHSIYEYLPINSFVKSCETIIEIRKLRSSNSCL